MKRGVKVPGCRGGCLSAVCFLGCPVGGRGSVLCRLVAGSGAWCCCRVLLSGLVVWACFGSCSRDLFLPVFLKRGCDPKAPTQEPVFRQVPLLLPRYLLTIYLAVDFQFLLILSCRSLVFFLRLLRQMQSHFRRRGVTGNVCCGSVGLLERTMIVVRSEG